MDLVTLFRDLSKLSAADRTEHVLRHPVLLSPSRWSEIEQWAGGQAGKTRTEAQSLLTSLKAIYSKLQERGVPYPLGTGPVETLWARVDGGELTMAEAIRRAGAEKISELLAPIYVASLTSHAKGLLNSGDWRKAVKLMQILLAALDHCAPGADRDEMVETATRTWMITVYTAVADVPDGRLFADVVKRAAALETELKARKDSEGLRWLYQDLGALHLDPYNHGRSTNNFMAKYDLWQQRLDDEYGADTLAMLGDEIRMPPPAEAFATAASYMRRAAALGEGKTRARALKGLADALGWSKVVKAEVDQNELLAAAREALEFFGRDEQYVNEQASLHAMLNYLGETDGKVEVDEGILNIDPAELARRTGARTAVSSFTNLANSLLGTRPKRAWELLLSIRPLVEEIDDEVFSNGHFEHELHAYALAFGPGAPKTTPKESLAALAKRCVQTGSAEGWNDRQLAASLTGIALYGPTVDQEDEAEAVLDQALKAAPTDTIRVLGGPLSYLRRNLLIGKAVNALNIDNIDQALGFYLEALSATVSGRLRSQTLNMVRRINDLIPRAGLDGIHQSIAGFAADALKIELLCSARGLELIQRSCQVCQARLAQLGGSNPVALGLLWQIAKGHSFSVALRVGARFDWRFDERGRKLLEHIREASQSAPPQEDAPGDALLDEDLLLSSYAGEGDRASGENPAQIVENLQHEFDAHVSRSLVADLTVGAEALRSIEAMQGTLSKRTVVVHHYIAPSAQGALGLYALIMTSDELRLVAGQGSFPWSSVRMGGDGREISVSPFALLCGAVRRNIKDTDPYPANASAEALRQLKGLQEMALGGPILKWLSDLKAGGRDHLCILSHGPFHFVPFHLMESGAGLLADDWIVTYCPNFALLDRLAGGTKARKFSAKEVAAFGLDFVGGQPHGMPPLPNASQEARSVAACFSAQAVTNEKATEASFLAAIENARLIHVATHGRHHVIAPAFQHLLFTPAGKSDGIVHAYEVLAWDLHNVDLLSLSACETALGRFDLADNLRGLPASFLLAGVKTIVGSLWEAETGASERFFHELYTALAAGSGKLDAFAAAQRRTRSEFPNYRDWGAFVLLGEA